jgi:hypothetical protein
MRILGGVVTCFCVCLTQLGPQHVLDAGCDKQHQLVDMQIL